MKEPEVLIEQAKLAQQSRYYNDAYRLLKEALKIYGTINKQEERNRCEKEITDFEAKYVNCAPLPAIDYHAHPLLLEEMKKEPATLMAAIHFRVGEEILPKTIEDMIKHMDEANIEKAVIMATDTSASEHWVFQRRKTSNDDVAKIVEKFPERFIGYGSVDPRRKDAVEETERCIKELKFQGMKFHPAAVSTYPNDEKLFYPIYEKCVELGVPVQSHCGTTGLYFTKIKYTQPIYYDDVATDFPTLKLVLLHFGIGGWHQQAMSIALRHPNVYLDISGASPRIIPQDLIYAANTPFYQDKILFGTDYPFMGMSRWMSAYNKVLKNVWTEETQRKIFRENAVSIHEKLPISPYELLKERGIKE